MRGTSLIRICEVAGTGVRLWCGTCFFWGGGSPHLAAATERGPPSAAVTGQGGRAAHDSPTDLVKAHAHLSLTRHELLVPLHTP